MKRNKTIIIVLLLVLIINIVMIVKSNNNKEVMLDEVKLKEEISKNDSIAIMLEQNDGTYKESNESIFPTNMIFNSEKSGCIDSKGNKLDNSLLYNNGMINLTTNVTTYCYVYFDRKENGSLTLSETSGTVNKGSTKTFTVTNNISGGALSVASGDNNIATASVSGNTITITGVNEGSTTITVTSAETDNYLSSSVTYNVTVQGLLKLTVTGDVGIFNDYQWYVSLYHYIPGEGGNSLTDGTYELPYGTSIDIETDPPGSSEGFTSISFNNEVVNSGTSQSGKYYSWTLTSDTIISVSRENGCYIYINEIPEGHVSVILNGTGYGSYASATIDGVSYTTGQDARLTVPIGTTIYLTVKDKTDKGTNGEITYTKNGTSISTGVRGAGSYDFVIEGNTTIKFGYYYTYNDQNKQVYYGTIDVTETT